MKKIIACMLALCMIVSLVACSDNTSISEQSENSNNTDDFANAIPVEVNDNIIRNCTVFAENLGYEIGNLKKSVLLGEKWIDAVYCDDDMKQDLIDSKDIVVVFEGIRCVVDADTEIVLGRIPYV